MPWYSTCAKTIKEKSRLGNTFLFPPEIFKLRDVIKWRNLTFDSTFVQRFDFYLTFPSNMTKIFLSLWDISVSEGRGKG